MVRPRCVTTEAAGETCNGGPRYVRGYLPTPAERRPGGNRLMGAGNALLVCDHWHHLPANPFKIFIRMSLLILDKDEKPVWRGGDSYLLQALGRAGLEDERAIHAADVTLRKAIGHLLREGALEYKIRPRKGLRPEYWCHWIPQGSLAASARESCESRKDGLRMPQGSLGPKEEGGGMRNRDEEGEPEATTSPAAVDNPKPRPDPSPNLCPHGNPAGRVGGPGTEPTCPECRRATR